MGDTHALWRIGDDVGDATMSLVTLNVQES